MEAFLNELEKDGLTIFKDMFDKDDIRALNDVASELSPFVGNIRGEGWQDDIAVHKLAETNDLLTEIEWLYHWSKTPEDNQIINEKILPVLSNVCNKVFDNEDWDWQMSNRYVMTNYKHGLVRGFDVQPHLDAPYLWPQRLDCQMAKYLKPGILSLTFMIPLINFTPENGATAYVRGTHKYIWDTAKWNEAKPVNSQFFKDNYVQPLVEAGSFACFYGNCMHSIMPNNTNEPRRGIIYRAIRQDALDEMEKLGLG